MLGWLFGKRPASGAAQGRIIRLAPGGKLEVVGESHYQDTLEELCGGRCEEGHDVSGVAILLAEPTNVHDSNAVRVLMEGELVGYLSRRDAVAFNDVAARMGVIGEPIVCYSRIRGGWSRGGDEGHFGVVLDAAQPFVLNLVT